MTPSAGKAALQPLRAAMATFAEAPVRAALASLLAPHAVVHLAHPFGTVPGEAMYDVAYAGLLAAMPDLERRDMILVAGSDADGEHWVGACGHYVGTFVHPFLDIAPTGGLAAFRFHEFFRLAEGRVVEVQAVWDIPELMLAAGACPMAPQLGATGYAFAPLPQDGLATHADGAQAASRVSQMLAFMVRHPAEGGPEVMALDRFWHPRFNWYGPAGIGAARGVRGFRAIHQIPFLAAMPDRGKEHGGTRIHLFGEGPYAAVTGWPNMALTLTGGNWLGLPATGARLTLRSLDFWRLEGDLIRENWVLIDLLDVYRQLGIDPLARMRAVNAIRAGRDPDAAADARSAA